jgi:ribonuclease J
VGDLLHQIVARAEGAVIVAMFASNVHRLRMLGEVARHTRRRIVLLGRSVATHSRVARATGYLDWPSDLVFPAERAKELPRANVLALASGTQAESRGALARLARGDHNNFALDPSDTIILSSRTIPGNEPMVYRMMGDLLRRGVKLRSWVTDRGIHVSGHAHRSEQKRMLELVRPKNFVPVHGTLHHLTRHAELARETGVANTCILENGDVGTLDAGGFTKTGRVTVGRDYAFHGRPLPHQVLRERTSLASEGLVVATLVAKADGIDLRIASRGVLDEARDKNLLGAMKREAVAAYAEAKARGATAAALEEPVRLALRRVLFQELGFKPTTLVTVVEAS